MKTLATVVACCLLLALADLSLAAEKDAKTTKDKLVGVWVVTKGDEETVGAVVEFTKEGKMIVTIKMDDKIKKNEGTYTVDNDSITSILKDDGKEHKETVKIKKLTDKELVVEVDEGKKTIECKKK